MVIIIHSPVTSTTHKAPFDSFPSSLRYAVTSRSGWHRLRPGVMNETLS